MHSDIRSWYKVDTELLHKSVSTLNRLRMNSQHKHSGPLWVPHRAENGTHKGNPAGPRRFLSAGTRRDPPGQTERAARSGARVGLPVGARAGCSERDPLL